MPLPTWKQRQDWKCKILLHLASFSLQFIGHAWRTASLILVADAIVTLEVEFVHVYPVLGYDIAQKVQTLGCSVGGQRFQVASSTVLTYGWSISWRCHVSNLFNFWKKWYSIVTKMKALIQIGRKLFIQDSCQLDSIKSMYVFVKTMMLPHAFA